MRGVVFLGGRKLELRDFPDPTPGPGEVVVAMKASGMCGSDLHPYRAVGNAAAALGLGGTGGPVAKWRAATVQKCSRKPSTRTPWSRKPAPYPKLTSRAVTPAPRPAGLI